MKRQNVRTLSLIVFTFTYLLVGAAVFDALESSHELELNDILHKQELQWKKRYNISKDDYNNITNLIIKMKPYKAGTQWKFAGSFYFATTVITTIGYGHSTPKTNGGKIFCMLYALPGIPLCIVMFQSIGERMNTFITSTIKFFKRLFQSSSNQEVSHTSLMIISSNITIIVIISGAAVFKYYENWSYLDSFYYCFITLTTIGFGDFVALQRNDTLAKRPDYVAFSLIFILFGLTVVSSVMNLLVLRFLTMNTEDERRDEIQAAAAAVYAYDQLRSHNNSITNGILEPNNISNFQYQNHHNYHQHHSQPLSHFHHQVQSYQYSNQPQFPNQQNNPIDEVNDINSNNKFNFTYSYCCCCFNSSQSVANLNNIHTNQSFQHNPTKSSFSNYLTCWKLNQNSVGDFHHQMRRRKRYTVIRDPAKVHHLAHSNCSTAFADTRKISNNNNSHNQLFHDKITNSKSVESKFEYPLDFTAQTNVYLSPPKTSSINQPNDSNQDLLKLHETSGLHCVNIDDIDDYDDDIDDILLDYASLNSIKNFKRSSI